MGVIKGYIKKEAARFVYKLYQSSISKECSHPVVMSVDDTIDILRTSEVSLVRFGDGEVQMIRGTGLKLQSRDEDLVCRMRRLLSFENDNLLITIPDIFAGVDQYVPQSRDFWKDHLLFCRKYYNQLCKPDKAYGNSFFSRCYIIMQDKSRCGSWFKKTREIWAGRKIVIVEGSATHDGVGNDLLDQAESVERIICPPRNAYAQYNEILAKCLTFSKDKMFLISLGPAAKPLTEDLFLAGYRALDIGNLDMEYEWFLQGAARKVKIPKHEILGEEANRAAGYNDYLNQIRYVIEG